MVSQKIISVTGASGFVGTNLNDYLKDAYEIHPMSVRFVVNQKFDVRGGHYSFVGKAHDVKKVSNPLDYIMKLTFELTKQLDSFLQSKASTFIFMSTVKAVADEVQDILTEEAIPVLKPIMEWPSSKRSNAFWKRNSKGQTSLHCVRRVHGQK